MAKKVSQKLQGLIGEYLGWLGRKKEVEEKLEGLKREIISQAREEKIRKITTKKEQVLIVSQTETRFPQIGEPGRKEVEKIVRESEELEKVMVFDIVALGNLYDQGKLPPALKEKLRPFAKKVQTTKIVIRPFSKTAQKT